MEGIVIQPNEYHSCQKTLFRSILLPKSTRKELSKFSLVQLCITMDFLNQRPQEACLFNKFSFESTKNARIRILYLTPDAYTHYVRFSSTEFCYR